ncbi:MAG TPA: fasciclin domain-containing protein [Candidatus Methylacidiphilales bacterium]|jgi:uncharacterized surface protein with fasciclin (FAS1) repeats|nr:fasciclin domain-containing protein [Candidatus Methylacidiphilales bacterium]
MKSRFPRAAAGALLLIALWLAAATGACAKEKPPKSHDLTDTIYANPILTSFAKLLQASPDIYTFLSSKGPFTMFVPTDSAFAKLKPGELDSLLQPQNADRRNAILLFHVINGKRLGMKDMIALHAMFSCQGNPLTFKLTHAGVFLVQKAKVTHADIKCANGNFNEIDTVLMPPQIALPALKAAPVIAPVSPTPAETNSYTTIPTITDTNSVPMVAPVVGSGAAAVTNAPPAKTQ